MSTTFLIASCRQFLSSSLLVGCIFRLQTSGTMALHGNYEPIFYLICSNERYARRLQSKTSVTRVPFTNLEPTVVS
ncbi:hypothetical protein BJ322DRAFT_1080015 [Thelephora terrestris]|uniref:Secreted protein n=1 Tax=Thelephora terrestris TaxID=56493 RepID=A0A9P6L3Y9_9AGAM|nr:hypothetical protein BJ322DRAFT_1080015 [Thelephora terrestris]